MTSTLFTVDKKRKSPSKFKDVLRLAYAYGYDFKRFAMHSGFRGRGTRREIESQIFKEFHRIEKGLTLRSPRPWFGKEPILRVIRLCRQYEKMDNFDRSVIESAHSTLAVYGTFFDAEPPQWWLEVSDEIQRSLAGQTVPAHVQGGFKPYHRGLPDARLDDAGAISQFIASRSSVRNYADRLVPDEVLHSAINDARQSPSVCNRQGTRIRLYKRGDESKRILECQNGNKGFGEHASHVALITSDLKAFLTVGERHQGYLDGGMYAMTLQYSLLANGVGTCCLNWSATPTQDKTLRQAAFLPHDEIVLLMIAIGYPAEGSSVTISPPRPDANIMIHDGS
ncbi:nitroreductase family protein [Rhodococcoides yunnanense]|uniref:nitroreductase family protein n=1 Tax=Rhodococcoides yunnanense TaxID=278209 RepID=UPI0022B1C3CF|nr:nitroreductase family protein [Rhodococcus yunnanensis]MCZ4278363.1 nitroreductase family protein [Rhodococcus yunnanensis]